MTTFELAEILERRRAKCYGTFGEAFEDLLADVLCDARDTEPLPVDLAEVDAFWGEDE
jgi:hypothetical protein